MEAYLNEGLNKADMQAVDLFLQQNPDILNTYLENLEDISLEPTEINFTQKAELTIRVAPVGPIHQNNFTEYFVNSVEGTLHTEEQTALKNFLSNNPKLQPEFNLYQATLLKPDLSTLYPGKKGLLKKQRPAIPMFWSISAAASIVILAGAWWLWPSPGKHGNMVKQAAPIELNKKTISHPLQVADKNTEAQNFTGTHQTTDTAHFPLINNMVREKILPVQMAENSTATLPQELADYPSSLQDVPPVDIKNLDQGLYTATPRPSKKGLFDKIFSGEQTYIEDYVNAVFHTFKGGKKGAEKWVLKVERDRNGKSKKVKFTSPVFSAKIEN
jgi:hypothetical protein